MDAGQYAYEVYRCGSFSAAAKKLFLTQPALSAAVRKLEDGLGVVLFDRSASPLRLTPAGRVYMDALERIRRIENETREQLADLSSLRSGRVVVSGANFASSFIFPSIMMRFGERYGGVQVELLESNSQDLRQLLLAEEIDLLIAHHFDPALYDAWPLLDERLLLAVPEARPINQSLGDRGVTAEALRQGLPLSQLQPVALSRFAEEPFLILKKGNDMHRRALQLCGEAGFSPQVRIYLDQLITSYNLACAGMGAAFIPDVLARRAYGANCLFYRLEGAAARRQMFIGSKRNRYMTRACSAFIDVAREVYAADP